MPNDDIAVSASAEEVALFLGFVAFGAGLVTIDLLNAQATYRHLVAAKINGGYLIMARTHVWAARARLGVKLLMLLAGLLALAKRRRLVYFPMLAMVLLMDIDSIQFRRYRDQSVEAERKARRKGGAP